MTAGDLVRLAAGGLVAAGLSYVAFRSSDLAAAGDRPGTAEAAALVGHAAAIAALAALAFAFTIAAVRLVGGEG